MGKVLSDSEYVTDDGTRIFVFHLTAYGKRNNGDRAWFWCVVHGGTPIGHGDNVWLPETADERLALGFVLDSLSKTMVNNAFRNEADPLVTWARANAGELSIASLWVALSPVGQW